MGSKSKEKSKEAQKSTSKRGSGTESSPKLAAARPNADEGPKAVNNRDSVARIKAARPVTAEGRESTKEKRSKAAPPPPPDDEALDDEGGEDRPKRALGLRGAAPWAARHAAKHAAEARKRAAEPPPPGSARATIRTPSGVEEIKARIAELHNHVERIKSLRKNLNKSFFEIGLVLRDVQEHKLFTAKGFQSFEAFVEREIDLSKSAALRLVKLVVTFPRDKALEMGYERALDALAQLEGVEGQQAISDSKLPISKPVMPISVTRGPIVGRLQGPPSPTLLPSVPGRLAGPGFVVFEGAEGRESYGVVRSFSLPRQRGRRTITRVPLPGADSNFTSPLS